MQLVTKYIAKIQCIAGHMGWRPPSGRPAVISSSSMMRAKGVSSETHCTEQSVSAPYNPSYCRINSGDSTNSDGCCETPTSNDSHELSWRWPNQWVLQTNEGYVTKTSLATRNGDYSFDLVNRDYWWLVLNRTLKA